jgi:hypothetical protein
MKHQRRIDTIYSSFSISCHISPLLYGDLHEVRACHVHLVLPTPLSLPENRAETTILGPKFEYRSAALRKQTTKAFVQALYGFDFLAYFQL